MQKTAERIHFDHFLTQVPELAGATINEGETPDFVCSLPDRTIGVELTEFHHDNAPTGNISQRQIEVFEQKVVAAAQPIFEANNGLPLYVSVGFYEDRVITERPEVLARGISDTVAKHLPGTPVTSPASVIVRDRELPTVLQPWVATILIMRFARNNVRLWKRDISITGIEGDVTGIDAVIAGKEADIPTYRPCDEYWLLIYASADMLASTMVPAQSATGQTYATAFDRAYLLDSVDRVHQLKT